MNCAICNKELGYWESIVKLDIGRICDSCFMKDKELLK